MWGLWGLWPVGRSQHLRAPPHGHTAVGFPEQKTSATPEGTHTSIRKTQTNTRPGSWLPWGWEDTAPPQHTEPESKEASGVALWRERGKGWGRSLPGNPCCQGQP